MWLAVVLGAAGGGLLGSAVPQVLRRLPDPTVDADAPHPEPPARQRLGLGGLADLAEARSPYADLAARPGVGPGCAVAAAVVGGLVGLTPGWTGALPVLVFLGAVGVLLGLVDWRSAWLPSRVILPSYAVLVGLLLLAAALDRDGGALIGAALGWLVWGGVFGLLWVIHPRGLAFGDVRLSGLLGLALGYLGWGEVVVGIYAVFLLAAVGGLSLRLLGWRRFPLGPFMLVGGLVGVLAGSEVWSGLGL